jgi:hypothetical protein
VIAALRILHPRMRNAAVAELFLRMMEDEKLRRDFRSRPNDFFISCGIRIPENVKIDVQEMTADAFPVVIPNEVMGPMEAVGPLIGTVDLTDDDLVSEGALLGTRKVDDYWDGNWWNINNKQDYKLIFHDRDPNTADKGNYGKDSPADT